MSDELREKVWEYLLDARVDMTLTSENITDAILALISTSSLSQPSGVVVTKKCVVCDGCGNIMIEHGDIRHPNTCYACGGTGEIVREMTVGEVVEAFKQHVNDTMFVTLPSGERVKIKEEI